MKSETFTLYNENWHSYYIEWILTVLPYIMMTDTLTLYKIGYKHHNEIQADKYYSLADMPSRLSLYNQFLSYFHCLALITWHLSFGDHYLALTTWHSVSGNQNLTLTIMWTLPTNKIFAYHHLSFIILYSSRFRIGCSTYSALF